MHGDGVYFAINASYSAIDTYSKPNGVGIKQIYYSKVLVGEFAQGQQGMRVPPEKTGSKDLFDSVTDDLRSPSMFVIFSDTQAYPEFLIQFRYN